MLTRILCPNCGRDQYLPLLVTEAGGEITCEPYRGSPTPPGIPDPDAILTAKLDRIFVRGCKAFAIDFDNNKTILTPKLTIPKLLTGPVPSACPDCEMPFSLRGATCRSTAKIGFMQFVVMYDTKDEAALRAKMFPDGVQWSVEFTRLPGNKLRLRSIMPTTADEPATTAPTDLASIREQAVMDGIEGAEKMTAVQIASARAKLQTA